jgi:hypothetical protein
VGERKQGGVIGGTIRAVSETASLWRGSYLRVHGLERFPNRVQIVEVGIQ